MTLVLKPSEKFDEIYANLTQYLSVTLCKVFEKYGVIHYSVANIPGSVARTSTIALTNETLKYLLDIVDKGLVEAIKQDSTLAAGVNTFNGNVTNLGVAKALNMDYVELPSLIGF